MNLKIFQLKQEALKYEPLNNNSNVNLKNCLLQLKV